MSSAAIVSPADAALGKRHVFGDVPVEVVADHQHVEVLVERVDRERARRVRRAGQHVRLAAHADDVGRVAAAGAFGVVRVDRASLERRNRIVDEAGLVERVGVNGDLHVVLIGHGQAAVDGRRRRAPVFVQLQPDGAGANLLVEPFRHGSCCPCRGTRSSSAARRWPAASARDTTSPACRSSLWCPVAGPVPPPMNVVTPLASASSTCCGTDEVDVRVDAAGGEDEAFAGDGFGRHADDQVGRDARHHVRIAGLADAGDAPVLDADVGLVDAGPVDDERVGDHESSARSSLTPAACPMPSRSTLPPPNLHSSP